MTTKVTGEMLIRANEAASARGKVLRAEGQTPDFMNSFFAIMEEFGDEVERETLVDIVMRMMALARLVQRNSLGKWTMEVGGKKYSLVQESVFNAAAVADLNPTSGEFDSAEIIRLALELSEEEGNA